MTDASRAPLSIRGLVKVYRGGPLGGTARKAVLAVRDLDLELRPREVLGLLGPNGSGKTTTLSVAVGLARPTRGVVRIFGESPRAPAARRRLGYLPEETPLYAFLTATEILDYHARLCRLDRATRRSQIAELLDLVGMRPSSHRSTGTFSRGMLRRVGIAQALVGEPDMLVLDEPMSGLDPLGVRDMKDLLRRLRDRGTSILLSSHLLAEMEEVCDRVALLCRGRKVDEGTFEELLRETEPAVASRREGLESWFLRRVREAEGAAKRDRGDADAR